LEKEREKLNQLNDKKEKELNSTASKKNELNKIDLNELKVKKDYLLHLNKNIETQKKEVQSSNKKVDENREELLFASKDKKVLEKLKSKYYENYKKMKNLKENKQEDEVAGRIASKKRSKESS